MKRTYRAEHCALLNQDLSADTTEFKSRSAAAENVTPMMIYDDYRKLSSDSVVHVCFALFFFGIFFLLKTFLLLQHSSLLAPISNPSFATALPCHIKQYCGSHIY